MPCYTIRQTPIVFDRLKHKVAHLPVLAAALKSIDFLRDVRYDAATGVVSAQHTNLSQRGVLSYVAGEFTIPQAWGLSLDAVKQAYAKTLLKTAATRFGWLVKETSETEGELVRRY